MPHEPITLVNLLKVEPENQERLIALLQRNIDGVICTLDGWRTSRLIAAQDGASVVIYSEWETAEAVDAMRRDPRMMAYFPKIRELAEFSSVTGHVVLTREPQMAVS
ncbi:putative quinol monooxygenase [Rhizobium halophytocola]|uniref:Quinol monooxygenase YgiN n=1 Tax=Rhizobium halophytocola TaxID=735519 RepID=A0ABS4DVD5_9HYPH|nr:antibiotic biosynthesis monooxygenase [Rhizobium halophytocola]MBP1849660.1 quinol monooxygenase YgiN [Rhizobium halophytocola]